MSNGGGNAQRLGRQMLAEIVHRSVRVQCGEKSTDTVFTRCLRMFIPALTDPDEKKPLPCGWCARQTRHAVPSIRIESQLPQWNDKIGSLSMRFANNRVRAASKKNFICFTDKMPSRDDSRLAAAHSPKRRRTVSMDIERRASLSHQTTRMDGDDDDEKEEENARKKVPSRDSSSEEGCFQVGKVRKGKFNVDFRFPVSPVQAFAAALTTFNWTAKET